MIKYAAIECGVAHAEDIISYGSITALVRAIPALRFQVFGFKKQFAPLIHHHEMNVFDV